MTENAVEFIEVAKRRGGFKLGPLSLVIPRGVIFGLVGPNGAGKTTALDLLAGLGRPDAGCIKVGGLDVTAHEVAVKLRLAYAGPETSYAAWRRVGRAIDFVSGFYKDWDDARCDTLLTAFGLNRDKAIASLSFGEKNKLSLLMALSRDPDLLVLDEPTTGLDPTARRFLFADLLHRMRGENRTIIIATHQLSELERFADRVALLDRGNIRLCGDLASLVDRFVQIDIAWPDAAPPPQLAGITFLERSGGRARALVDVDIAAADWRTRLSTDIIGQSALTLEELYLALVGPAAAARVPETQS
jgi:ABC-2 type transport system ATP-binding protein